jgi:hypothetical protein
MGLVFVIYKGLIFIYITLIHNTSKNQNIPYGQLPEACRQREDQQSQHRLSQSAAQALIYPQKVA